MQIKHSVLLNIICCIISYLTISGINAQECPADESKLWSYEPKFSNGPTHWHTMYPGCAGRSQSPININTRRLSRARGHQKLNIIGYEIPITEVLIENNGHAVDVSPRDEVERSLILDNVKYNFEGIHFHWGDQSNKGSEHKINGHRFTMEAHFVHRNDRGEIAVVGVFFSEEKNRVNPALHKILNKMYAYRHEDENFEGEIYGNGIQLKYLIDNRCSYYRYNGSLTTPPCSENVKWLLCRKHKHVKRYQMRQFYRLFSVKREEASRKCHLINIYRPVQPLNSRKVYV